MPPRWPFSRSLLYPLTALLVGLAVLPVALAGWGFVSSNREQVATLEMQYLTRQSVGLAREVELYFLDSVGRIEAVAKALRVEGKAQSADAAEETLNDLVNENRHIVLLRLLDSTGKGSFIQNRTMAPAAERELESALGAAFTASMGGRPVRRDLVRISGEDPMVVISVPLRGAGGGVAGAMQGVVSLEGLVARLAEESGKGMTVDVVDRTGTVVFSNDQTHVGKSAATHPLVAQFLEAPVRLTKTYRDPLRPAQDQVLGSLCPVEDPPWAVVTARDVSVAFAAVRSMGEKTALLALVTGLVAMAAGVLVARRITSPLRHLADVSTAVAQGDFTRQVPVTSRNELGQLAENFNVMAVEIERTVSSLQDALDENKELLVDSIRALAAAIDAKNPYTSGHSERVSQYAVAIARHCGIEGQELQKVEIAALLHDVGKIGIDDAILTKPDALTDSEFAQMRVHTVKGAAIVSPIKRLREMLPGIRSHHENWGGGGYPDGLVGDQIPMVARIIAAADVFDAMTTHRPYQAAMRLDFVFRRMSEMAGTRLDPTVVRAFLGAVKAGDLVPLNQVEVA
ncbi:MAG TPA: HD domain-containing phosphohydrolase [Thermoanaerobaculaceae bacterium]|nr:HD domain-containing phosphohydrolase [Thermoanaerobaculaceae bacterium]